MNGESSVSSGFHDWLWWRRPRRLPPLWHFHRAIANSLGNEEDVVESYVVQIEGVDWMHAENGAKHRTSRYELSETAKACVVRRGQEFTLALVLRAGGRAFDPNRDRVKLVFEFGDYPNGICLARMPYISFTFSCQQWSKARRAS